MEKSVKDVLALIKEKNIKMVDFKMVDINGQYRHVTIPAENFSEEVMQNGIGFDASNYGYAVVEKSDMVFIPDPETARKKQRIILEGDVPSPLKMPSGCPFRTRCRYATEKCAQERPELTDRGNGHMVACWNM